MAQCDTAADQSRKTVDRELDLRNFLDFRHQSGSHDEVRRIWIEQDGSQGYCIGFVCGSSFLGARSATSSFLVGRETYD